MQSRTGRAKFLISVQPLAIQLSSSIPSRSKSRYLLPILGKLSFKRFYNNSSWAQERYLVAAEISSDEDFRAELRRLSAAFGIGILSISLDDPDASEILAPARERDAVDWDTLNKPTMNKDVAELLRRITYRRLGNRSETR
jgi:hypothetical protein